MEAWQSEYPFPSRWIELDGLRYHYLDEGEGPVLLMVHGNPTWSFHFRHLVRHFRQAYRVVAVDHLGCGLSDKPQRYPYTLEQHVHNLEYLVKHLDLTDITLVAQDWGGPIGLSVLLRHVERFTGIVLLNTGAFPPPYIPRRIQLCRIPALGTLAVRGANAFVRAARWMAPYQPRRLTLAACQGLAAPYDSWANRVAIDRFVKDIPSRPKHPTWKALDRLEAGLRRLGPLPVLLIWGMRDWCFRPECLARLEKIFPQSEVAALTDVGHWVLEEAPDEVIARMDEFLRVTQRTLPRV